MIEYSPARRTRARRSWRIYRRGASCGSTLKQLGGTIMSDLTASVWLVVLATIAGPVVAVQAQKFIERAREKREGRRRLFYALMGTRAARVAPGHVRALNMIDLEFYGPKIFGFRLQFSSEKGVINTSRICHDHRNQCPGARAV